MIRRFLFSFGVVAAVLFASSPMLASASTGILGGVDCTGPAASSAVCTDRSKGSSNPVSGPGGLLYDATNIIAIIAGVTAVILLLVGALKYITAGGDSGKIESAKNTVINTLVGIVVIVVVRTLVVFVINKFS